MYNRRHFLRATGKLTLASLILPYYACSNSNTSQENADKVKEENNGGSMLTTFGIQLWTLRDIIGKDPKGALRQLSEYGYRQIESYEGEQGIFWGMSNTEYQAYLKELGMEAMGSHCNIMEGFEEKAAQAGEIGMKYLTCPWVGPQESMDDFKRFADRFNECGAICQKNGLRFAYHNHAYSFEELEGQIPQDYLLENTDPSTVDFEMDIYWVVTAGVDPLEHFKRYPNRYRLAHVKDRMKDAPADETNASCILGQGSIDYPTLLPSAMEQGLAYFIVEQERYDGTTPLDCAKANADYLGAL